MNRIPIDQLPARYQDQIAAQIGHAAAYPSVHAQPPFSCAAPDSPTMRQSRRPMNKTEARFLEFLHAQPEARHVEREGLRFRLGNGAYYKPDFVSWHEKDGRLDVWETKGHMREAAGVRLKAAAAKYPWARFWLVRHSHGQWQVEEVRP